MDTAATRFESPTPNSAFCIVMLSASPATLMPVNKAQWCQTSNQIKSNVNASSGAH
jgi:hypothetical protein